MRGLPSPVRHGEHVVGCKPAERSEPDRHAQDRAERRGGGLVDRQVHPGEADGHEDDPDGPLRLVPVLPGNDEGVGHPDERDREARDGLRRRGVPRPRRQDRHPQRAGPADPQTQLIREQLQHDDRADEHEEVPPTAERDQRRERPPSEQADHPAGGEHVHGERHLREPRGPDRHQPPQPFRVPAFEEPSIQCSSVKMGMLA